MVRCLLALNNFHSAFKPRPLNINPFRFKSFKSKMPEKSTESQTPVLQVCKLSEHALIPTKGSLTLNTVYDKFNSGVPGQNGILIGEILSFLVR